MSLCLQQESPSEENNYLNQVPELVVMPVQGLLKGLRDADTLLCALSHWGHRGMQLAEAVGASDQLLEELRSSQHACDSALQKRL